MFGALPDVALFVVCEEAVEAFVAVLLPRLPSDSTFLNQVSNFFTNFQFFFFNSIAARYC